MWKMLRIIDRCVVRDEDDLAADVLARRRIF